MKTQFSTLLLLTVFSILLFDCKKKKDDPAPEQDLIIINSVTPSTGLIDGQTTHFEVVVQYKLASKDEGQLNIGFNNYDPKSSALIMSASKLVSKGIGTYTFSVDVAPKNWGATPFHTYVNLSEYPHAMTWIPLAYTQKDLSF